MDSKSILDFYGIEKEFYGKDILEKEEVEKRIKYSIAKICGVGNVVFETWFNRDINELQYGSVSFTCSEDRIKALIGFSDLSEEEKSILKLHTKKENCIMAIDEKYANRETRAKLMKEYDELKGAMRNIMDEIVQEHKLNFVDVVFDLSKVMKDIINIYNMEFIEGLGLKTFDRWTQKWLFLEKEEVEDRLRLGCTLPQHKNKYYI